MPTTRREWLRNSIAFGALTAIALRNDALALVQDAVRTAGAQPLEQAATDENFWAQIQQAFTVDRSVINLNNGGISPSPRVVQDAMRRHYEFANNLPARNLWQVQDPQVEGVRIKLAALFGASPDEIAITRNASESLETCLLGIDLNPGDEVVAADLDYPRMLTTIRQREQREGIKLVLVPIDVPMRDGADVIEAYRRAITPRTRMLLVSHVVFLTGQVFPVAEIVKLGRERDIPVIVDGAHAFAHLDYRREQLGCDYYGVSLHKWLTAPHGTGLLYVRKDRIGSLWPLMAAQHPRSDNIRKFEEIGTHPAANQLAIAEAVTFHNAIGSARKLARLRYLRDRWAKRIAGDKRVSFLANPDEVNCGGFVTFSIDGIEHEKLQAHLWEKHKIFTVYVALEGKFRGIRVSPNVYTTVDEIDAFSAVLEGVLSNGLPA